MMKLFTSMAAILAAVLLSGCVTTNRQPLQGPVYDQREARSINYNELAVVLDVRPVIIQGQKSSTGMYTGAALGTALGGLLGSKVGRGKGKTAATLVGGAFGASVGADVGDKMAEESARVQGVEVVVRRGDGQMQSIIQPVTSTEIFKKGQNVRLTQSPGGWHVSPL